MGQTHQREAAIFDAVLELPPERRSAYLNEACGGDAALRRRVESLIKACESQCVFLDSPASAATAAAPTLVLPVFEKPGDTIGRYKLLEQIGQGGCGVVYVAEQTEPIRRRVALKIIKLGMDTKSVIARFEAERQALALMDHPNIAKVFDAGATETGRPYFVMELVRGMKITEFCDEKKLSTKQRLDLFVHVCQAIQHAHQKGIIHRDIKPSNILVSMNDGVMVPKVIDFGIAKATSGQQLTDKTLFTAFEQFIGTPAYMSPEQAMITNVDIDTRSDIYALGVLLYELLTGKTPFDAKELLAIGLDEMRRTIREQEPPRPSTRLSTLAQNELSTTAQRRGLDAPKLVIELRGDLDWIVMKALEKDRARRYDTANGLAADIQRHLNNEPVVASPPSRLYRLQKMVRRNKLAFTAAMAVTAALVVGIAGIIWQWQKARENYICLAITQAENELILGTVSDLPVREIRMHPGSRLPHLVRDTSEQTQQRQIERFASIWAGKHSPSWKASFESEHGTIRFLPEISPAGNMMVAVDTNQNVFICDSHEGRALTPPLRHPSKGSWPHPNKIYVACFSADGTILATGSSDGTIRIWDVRTGHLRAELSDVDGGSIVGIRFGLGGKHMVGLTARNTLTAWDTRHWQVARSRTVTMDSPPLIPAR